MEGSTKRGSCSFYLRPTGTLMAQVIPEARVARGLSAV